MPQKLIKLASGPTHTARHTLTVPGPCRGHEGQGAGQASGLGEENGRIGVICDCYGDRQAPFILYFFFTRELASKRLL